MEKVAGTEAVVATGARVEPASAPHVQAQRLGEAVERGPRHGVMLTLSTFLVLFREVSVRRWLAGCPPRTPRCPPR